MSKEQLEKVDPGLWYLISEEQLEDLIILIEHGIELIDACFYLSVSWREAMIQLKDKVSTRHYVNCIKPLMKTFREAGMPIRQVEKTFNVSFRTAYRAGLSEEELKILRKKERENAAERKKKDPSLIEYQRQAMIKWRNENYEIEKEKNRKRRARDPELFKQKQREATNRWRAKSRAKDPELFKQKQREASEKSRAKRSQNKNENY